MELDISAYCGRPIPCTCGQTHFCPIAGVVIRKGALEALRTMLSGFSHILLVADQNTYSVCGNRVHTLLGGKVAGLLVYRRSERLVPDEQAVDALTRAVPEDCDFILGVGSGVINDLCKFVSWKLGLDCGIVATAPSMDGYASSGAAMITAGMKVTYTTHPPKYILADVDVVKHAPIEMIRAGYGDIIGKYSSLNDWKLSNLITGEYLCQPVYDLVLEVTDHIRASAPRIVAREDSAIEALMKALVLIGVTLSLVGSTRPGSGSEHHISHFFEVTGLVHGQPHFIHGTDVAYATVLTAFMRQQICAREKAAFTWEPEARREAQWARIFGRVAPEVRRLQEQAGSYSESRDTLYREKWPQILDILAQCPTAGQIRKMLEDVGLHTEDQEAMYGHEKICDAMLYAKDLKDRYSFLWIYYALFCEDRAVADYQHLAT